MKKIFFLVCLSVFFNAFGQKSIIIDSIIHLSIDINKKNKLVDKLLEQHNDSSSIVDAAHKYSIFLFKKNKYNYAIKYTALEINYHQKLDTKFNNALYNLGYFYYKIGDYNKSILIYNSVIHLNIDSFKVAKSFSRIGNCFDKIGDFVTAIKYYEKSVSLLEKQEKYHTIYGNYNTMFAIYDNYTDKKSLEQKLILLNKSKQLEDKISFTEKMHYQLNNNFAMYYLNDAVFDFKKSKQYYLNNLNKALVRKDSIIISASYINLGELYNRIQNDSAIYFLKKGILFEKENNDICQYNIANYYANRGQFRKAFSSINNSLKSHLEINGNIDSLMVNQLKKSNNRLLLLSILNIKIKTLLKLYQTERDEAYIKLALQNCKVADLLIDLINKNTRVNKSKLFWQKEVSSIYTKALYSCNELSDFEQAFYFIEKSRALLLMDEINKNSGKLIRLENKEYENILLFNLKQHIKENKISIIRQRVNDINKLKFKHNHIINNKSKIVSLNKVFKYLKEDEIFMEIRTSVNDNYDSFRTKNDNVYIILLANKKLLFYKVKGIKNLKKIIVSYIEMLKKPITTKSELKRFKDLSFIIFDKLFPKEKTKKLIRNKKLIIATDDIFSFLPFETLITKKNSEEYLLLSSEVSYAYSMSFLQMNRDVIRKPRKKFLGIAPISFKYDSLTRLNSTKKEVFDANLLFKGDLLVDELATKQNFNDFCYDYSIIHLATHADASNKKSPWIAFKDEKIVLKELYNIKIQADLVTLSACNTSLGEIVNGEGVLSLARGFFYSGANSVVSTLWNVNDRSSAMIMEDFYKNLKNGKRKSESLRQAKINYLQTHSQEEASPYYWSSYILIGDTGKLESIKSSNLNKLYYIGLSVLIVLFFFFKYKK